MLAVGIVFLSGCQPEKTIYVPIDSGYSFRVNQEQATDKQPATFYLCDNEHYPCSSVTKRWSGESKIKVKKPHENRVVTKFNKHKSVLSINQVKEKSNDQNSKKNSCNCK